MVKIAAKKGHGLQKGGVHPLKAILRQMYQLKEGQVALVCYHAPNSKAKFNQMFVSTNVDEIADFILENKFKYSIALSVAKRKATTENVVTRKDLTPVDLDAVVIDLDFKTKRGPVPRSLAMGLINKIINALVVSDVNPIVYIAYSGGGAHIAVKVEKDFDIQNTDQIKNVMKYVFDFIKEKLLRNEEFTKLIHAHNVDVNKMFDKTSVNYDKLIRAPYSINEKYGKEIEVIYFNENPVALKVEATRNVVAPTPRIIKSTTNVVDNTVISTSVEDEYKKLNMSNEYNFVYSVINSVDKLMAITKSGRLANQFAGLYLATATLPYKQVEEYLVKFLNIDLHKVRYWKSYYSKQIPTNLLEITIDWVISFLHRHSNIRIPVMIRKMLFNIVEEYTHKIPYLKSSIMTRLGVLYKDLYTKEKIQEELREYVNNTSKQKGIFPIFAATGIGKTYSILNNIDRDKRIAFFVPTKALQETVRQYIEKLGLDNVDVYTIQSLAYRYNVYANKQGHEWLGEKYIMLDIIPMFTKDMIKTLYKKEYDVIVIDEYHEIKKLASISRNNKELFAIYQSMYYYINDKLITNDVDNIDLTVYVMTATPPTSILFAKPELAKWLFPANRKVKSSISKTNANDIDNDVIQVHQEISKQYDKCLIYINNKQLLAKVDNKLRLLHHDKNIVTVQSEVDKHQVLSSLPNDKYTILTTSSILAGFDSDVNAVIVYIDRHFDDTEDLLQIIGRVRHWDDIRVHLLFDKSIPKYMMSNIKKVLNNIYDVTFIKYDKDILKLQQIAIKQFTKEMRVMDKDMTFLSKLGVNTKYPVINRKRLKDLYLANEDMFNKLDDIFSYITELETWKSLAFAKKYDWRKSHRFYTTITTENNKSVEVVHDAYLEAILLNAGYQLKKTKKMSDYVHHDIANGFFYVKTNNNKRLYIIDETNVKDFNKFVTLVRRLKQVDEYYVDDICVKIYIDNDNNMYMITNLVTQWITDNAKHAFSPSTFCGISTMTSLIA